MTNLIKDILAYPIYFITDIIPQLLGADMGPIDELSTAIKATFGVIGILIIAVVAIVCFVTRDD